MRAALNDMNGANVPEPRFVHFAHYAACGWPSHQRRPAIAAQGRSAIQARLLEIASIGRMPDPNRAMVSRFLSNSP